MKYSIKVHSPAGLRGVELLDTPIWNKGRDFDEAERGTQQTLAEKARRPSKKSEIGDGMLSRGVCRMSDMSTECLEFSFGPFRLMPERQLLLGGEKPVNLGARGLELLHALVEHSGEVVSKDELIARIWPDTCVSESNLKVQIAALRRALGEGRRGDRYIATVSGRGYRFIAPIERHSTFHAQHETVAPEHNLSRGWTRPLGRDDRATRRQPPEVTDATGLSAREQLNRLAGEVHDGLAQHLTAIFMQLSVAKEALSSTGGNPLCNIEQAIELAKLGLVEARRCAHNLCCSVFDESGLRVALKRLAERWTVDGRLRCDFQSDKVPETRLSGSAKHQLLRIVQEAIHNAVRHANPTRIVITLQWHAPNLVLQVTDNGTGIPADRLENCEGFGLRSMRQRAQEIDARIEVHTTTGRGTSIIVTVPIAL